MLTRHHHLRLDGRVMFAATFGILGMLQFVVCVGSAAQSRGGFRFGHEFLSNLGKTSNPGASVFNGSMILLGVCLIVFFAVGYLIRTEESAALLVFGSSGVLASCGLIGIGATPLDLYFVLHHVFLVLWLIPMVIMVMFSFFVFETKGVVQTLVLIVSAILGMGTGLYIMNGMDRGAPAFQAVVASTATVWLLLTAADLTQTAVFQIVEVRHGNDRATRDYISRLKRDGLYRPGGRSSGKWEP